MNRRAGVDRLAALIAIGLLVLAGCVGGGGAAGGGANPSASTTAGLVDIGAGLQGPAGLTASTYAQGLANVAALAVDEQGRVWAATAAFSDEGSDAIYVIPTQGAEPTKVVEGIHTPLGLLWVDDTLVVSSKERVERYSGFDGSRFASSETLIAFPTGVGELNQLALSPDGRIVLGISSPCDSCVPTSADSAAVVSFLPDGSDLRIDASGIRAPVGLAYDSATGRLYVTMNQRDDLGDDTPGDWLAVVEPGQDWRSPGCYGQGGDVCSGVPSPTAVLDTHAAVSGVAIVGGQLGEAVGRSAIVAEWAGGKVLRVPLDGTSGSPGSAGTAIPFLAGIKNPVPVLLTPAGVLLVGDWASGTVYAISSLSAS